MFVIQRSLLYQGFTATMRSEAWVTSKLIALHTLSSLSRACCLNFSKLAEDTGRETEEPDELVRLDQEGTCRIGLDAES